MMPHLEEPMLHALVDGEVPSTELPPIQVHLEGCAECRSRLEEARSLASEADRFLEALDAAAVTPAPARRARVWRPVRWAPSLAWAATLVLAAGLGYAVRGPSTAPTAEEVTTTPPVAQAAPPSAFPVAPAPAPIPATTARPTPAPRREAATPPTGEARRATPMAERVEPEPGLQVGAAKSAAAPLAAPRPGVAALNQASRDVAGTAMPVETAAPDSISFVAALARLGGTLRLIEGLVPVRLEALGPDVRVVYLIGGRVLVLSQRLIDGGVEWRLTGPPGFPEDSLARLRARVRE